MKNSTKHNKKSKITKYQNFVFRTISRSSINFADYNPRKISPENKKRLRKALKEYGLVMPIVWNERTGNCVAGHQRLEVMDSIHKNSDYELTVAVVNVDLKEEVKLNVVLNNENLMGEFDAFKVADLEVFDVDLKNDLMFDNFDLEMMGIVEDVDEEIKGYAEELAERKQKYRKENANVSNDISIDKDDYSITLIFDSNEAKAKWCKKNDINPSDKFAKGSRLL